VLVVVVVLVLDPWEDEHEHEHDFSASPYRDPMAHKKGVSDIGRVAETPNDEHQTMNAERLMPSGRQYTAQRRSPS
jgi:hypothetical protein